MTNDKELFDNINFNYYVTQSCHNETRNPNLDFTY